MKAPGFSEASPSLGGSFGNALTRLLVSAKLYRGLREASVASAKLQRGLGEALVRLWQDFGEASASLRRSYGDGLLTR